MSSPLHYLKMMVVLLFYVCMKDNHYPAYNAVCMKDSHYPAYNAVCMKDSHYPAYNAVCMKDSHYPAYNPVCNLRSQYFISHAQMKKCAQSCSNCHKRLFPIFHRPLADIM